MTYSVNVKTNSHEVKLVKVAHKLLVDIGVIKKQDLSGSVSVSVSENMLTVECNTYAEEFVCIKCEIDANSKLYTTALKVSGGAEVEIEVNTFTLLSKKAKIKNSYRYMKLMHNLQLTYNSYLDIMGKNERINELSKNIEVLKHQCNVLAGVSNPDNDKIIASLYSTRSILKDELRKLKK